MPGKTGPENESAAAGTPPAILLPCPVGKCRDTRPKIVAERRRGAPGPPQRIGDGRCAYLREKEVRPDVFCKFPQIAIVPGRADRVIDPRFPAFAIPADAEAVSVGRLNAHLGMQALIDERVLRLQQNRLKCYG